MSDDIMKTAAILLAHAERGFEEGKLPQWLIDCRKSVEGVPAQTATEDGQPVAWRYRCTNWSEQYWHYFTKEPRFKEDNEIWQPLYLRGDA